MLKRTADLCVRKLLLGPPTIRTIGDDLWINAVMFKFALPAM
jgi:hypothetical protein